MVITINDINLIKLYTNDEIFGNGTVQKIINSGLFMQDSYMTAQINAADVGLDIITPYVKQEDFSEATIMDDSDDKLVLSGASKQNIMNKVMFLAKGWEAKRIARELDSGLDLLDVLEQRFLQPFWAAQLEKRAVSSLIGCEQADTTRDVTEDFSKTAVINAMKVAGAKQDEFSYIVVHPNVYAEMKIQDEIDFLRPTTIPFSKGFYGELEIILSEDLAVEDRAGTDFYTSYVCKSGVFTFAKGNLQDELEYVRDELTGSGAGSDGFVSRLKYVLGVNGFSYDGSAQAKMTGATLAELQNPAAWTRVVDKRDSGFVTLKTSVPA